MGRVIRKGRKKISLVVIGERRKYIWKRKNRQAGEVNCDMIEVRKEGK